MGRQIEDLSETELRGVLCILLDLARLGQLKLTDWQRNLCELKSSQGHYSELERKAIVRLLLVHYRSGAITRAIEGGKAINSPENHARIIKCAHSHADDRRNVSGSFWCPVCNSGKNVHYHVDNTGKVRAICENRGCVRVLEEQSILDQRTPHFANIIPQDIGTFLVESFTERGTFYGVDVIEGTCTCDAAKFHKEACKHLLESMNLIYGRRIF